LNKSKPGVKVERRDNGQPERHKCLRQVTKKQAAVTRTERFTITNPRNIDGNVFDWILLNAEVLRQLRRMERNAIEKPQQSLKDWTKQKWRTKSGKPSTQGPKATGERYLPESAIKSLSPSEYAATSRAKRAGKASGKQFVSQPKRIATKTARFR
jgi:hypothetical protein